MLSSYASDEEYSLLPVSRGGMSSDQYFTSKKIPDVQIEYRSVKNCENNCRYPVIVNQAGKILTQYPRSNTVSLQASGRYTDLAYLQYVRYYPCGDKTCSQKNLIDNTGRRYTPLRGTYGAYDSRISLDRKLYQVGNKGIYINGKNSASIDNALVSAQLNNNTNGNIAAVGVDENGAVYSSDTVTWYKSKIHLSEHGDRSNILALYPKNKNEIVLAVYKYTNAYNKGLMTAKINMKKASEQSGWIFNSSKRNVGFSPCVYCDNDLTYISAEDSTNREHVSMRLRDEDFALLDSSNAPDNIEGFENEEYFSFLLGTRLAHYNWHAKTYVEKDDVDYNTMRYDISNRLYTALYFEGRILNVQLGVSYLQNWIEKQGDLAKTASKVFSAFVDFNDLFGKSSSLRIEIEKSKINGTATYQRNDSAGVITGPASQTDTFEETLTDLAAKVMMERGWFAGVEYLEYATPAAVGFSNSAKQIEYITVDPTFVMQNYMLIGGYDEISYARRYETDLSRFYFQGNVSLGYSAYSLSQKTSKQVEMDTSKSINTTGSFIATGEMNVGYIWQSRFRTLQGFGYALTTGVKARGAWTGSGQSSESDYTIEADELELEMGRYDLWYGPYVSFNVLF